MDVSCSSSSSSIGIPRSRKRHVHVQAAKRGKKLSSCLKFSYTKLLYRRYRINILQQGSPTPGSGTDAGP